MEVSSDFLILNCDFYSVFLNLLLATNAREHDEVEGREELEKPGGEDSAGKTIAEDNDPSEGKMKFKVSCPFRQFATSSSCSIPNPSPV